MKKYRVCEYSTGKEVLIGTAEECAKLTGFKTAESFQVFVKHIADGSYTGRKQGYKAYYYDEDAIIHKENLKILDAFYELYYRSPTASQFIKCGGDYLMALRMCGTWCEYLNLCGYDKASHYKTIEAYDENGKLFMVGTREQVAKKFGYDKSYITSLISTKKSTADGYTFKNREVNEEDVRKHK